MLTVIPLSSLDHPFLHPYRTLRQPMEHFRSGVFVAEGERVVRRLMASPLEVRSALLTPSWLEEFRTIIRDRGENIEAYVAEKELLEQIVGFHLHQGIMALGKVPRASTMESVLRQHPSPRLFVALDGLTNAENLGVVVRNAVALGAHAIIVGETSSSPYLRRSVRNSMGAVFQIPVVHTERLTTALADLRTHNGFTVVGAHPHQEGHSLYETDLRGDCCLVFGSEGEGITPQVREVCTRCVAIPMASGVDSLNVASAAAAFLYEAARQRR